MPTTPPASPARNRSRATLSTLLAILALSACGGGEGTDGNGDSAPLDGDPAAAAVTAIRDVRLDTPPDPSELSTDEDGRTVQRTVFKIMLAQGATVSEVNELLLELSATIVASLEGYPALVVRIPDPGSLQALDSLVDDLESRDVVAYVIKSFSRKTTTLPLNLFEVFFEFGNPEPATADEWKWIKHQLAVRGAAAWSLGPLIQQKPTVVVLDEFGDGNPNELLRDQVYEIEPIPGALSSPSLQTGTPDEFGFTKVDPPQVPNAHGYGMLSIIAAEHSPVSSNLDLEADKSQLDDQDLITGMVPGGIQLGVVDLLPLSTVAADVYMMQWVRDAADASAAPVIVNISRGWDCGPDAAQCNTRADLSREVIDFIRSVRHIDAEDRALFVTAAGNVEPPGQADAATQSHWNASTLLDGWVDPFENVIVPSLTNVLVVENAAQDEALVPPFAAGCIHESSFVGGHVAGIGRELAWLFEPSRTPVADTIPGGGTSSATAQLSGVAAYVSALRPDLSPQELIEILVTTARPLSGEGTGCTSRSTSAGIVDAYASVLATDPPNTFDSRATARLRLLDITNAQGEADAPDGVFDEHDLETWVRLLSAEPDTLTEAVKLYSRYDLNGDGIAGTEGGRAPFDLDISMNPSSSDPILYSGFVANEFLDREVIYDESALTDIEIVCYYAYTDLYELGEGPLGVELRDQWMEEVETLCDPCAAAAATQSANQTASKQLGPGDPNPRCEGAVITIDPDNATTTPGNTVSFAATVTGLADTGVTWSATGGSINSSGLYTAGTEEGTFQVTATSVGDPTLSATATVRISDEEFDPNLFRGGASGDLIDENGESYCERRGAPEGFEDSCIVLRFVFNDPSFVRLTGCIVAFPDGSCSGTVSEWSFGKIEGNVFTADQHRTITFGTTVRESDEPCPVRVELAVSPDGTQAQYSGQLKNFLANTCGPDSTTSFTLVGFTKDI